MIRLHITVEGQTEERFVNRVLRKHLADFNVYVDVRCVLTSKKRNIEYRGGFRRRAAFDTVRKDLLSWMKEDNNADCRFTTMFDLYALPTDFPDYNEVQRLPDAYEKVYYLENALSQNISHNLFLPYIQLHEFETLIFVNPEAIRSEYPDNIEAIKSLIDISEAKPNPELINGGETTAPSKRIIEFIPEHEGNKTVGADIVELIGLNVIRKKCRHFNEWLEKLEALNDNRNL